MNRMMLKGKVLSIQNKYDTVAVLRVAVTRSSGVVDVVRMHAQKSLLAELNLTVGVFISAIGKMRSLNVLIGKTDNKVLIYMYAMRIDVITQEESLVQPNNYFAAQGMILSASAIRSAVNSDRLILNAILSIRKRNYFEAHYDYIPILCWNNDASYISEIGKSRPTISITGRLQSRQYYSNKRKQYETAYEISVSRLEPQEMLNGNY